MTLHEIMDKLHKSLPDEIKGVGEYCEMYNELKNMGQMEMAKKLRDMAKDEYHHAENIKHLLKKAGMPITKEHEELLENYEKKLERAYKEWKR